MSARTVTVYTRDEGFVTLPEPSWCTGVHQAVGFRADINHHGQPLEVTLADGTLLAAGELAQWPFSARNPAPFISVQLDAGESECDDAGLLEMQQRLMTFAAVTIPELRVRLAAAVTEARL